MLDMFIGFAERYRTVNENVNPSDETFSIPIRVNSNRTSEQNYEVQFRVLQDSTARVGPIITNDTKAFDAQFGTEDDDVIRDSRVLFAGQMSLSGIFATIINDFIPEMQECFTIRIVNTDTEGVRDVFNCTLDNQPGTDFFCLTTICINDTDSKVLLLLMLI